MVHRYFPQTEEDRKEMLSFLGVESVEELFQDIPEAVRLKRTLKVGEGLSEGELMRHMKDLDPDHIERGDTVIVLTKDDPKFPQKEVAEVLERSGERIRVRTRNGQELLIPLKDATKALETSPEQMWDRLAKAIAKVEKGEEKQTYWEKKFREVLEDWKLVPGGRIAAGAGVNDELTLFNCYVIPSPQDSREGIMAGRKEITPDFLKGLLSYITGVKPAFFLKRWGK